MELNREQVEKAMDWLDCLVGYSSNDSEMAMRTYQLLGILYDTCEELTEENKRLRADTLLKYGEKVYQLILGFVGEKLSEQDKDYITVRLGQIAKEMLEVEDED